MIDRKIKVAFLTAVWKRSDVFEMFAKGINHLVQNSDLFDISVIVAGSEGAKSKRMVEKHGYTYIETPNDPLSNKVNQTTLYCQNLDLDYVICLGSDDIMSLELLNEYHKHMIKGIDFIGVTDCFFYDTESKKSLYWGGYRESYRFGHTVGAFRAISISLLKKWNYKPWEVQHSKVLDSSIEAKLKNTKHTSHTFSLLDKDLKALDIKSSTNMTPFQQWDNSIFIDTKNLLKHFTYVFD